MGFGLFGGGNESATTSTSVSTTRVDTTNQSASGNAGPTAVGRGNRVLTRISNTVSDQGATAQAGLTSRAAIESASEFTGGALDLVATLGAQTQANLETLVGENRATFERALSYAAASNIDAQDFALSAQRSEASEALQNIAKWVALAFAGLGLLVMVKK